MRYITFFGRKFVLFYIFTDVKVVLYHIFSDVSSLFPTFFRMLACLRQLFSGKGQQKTPSCTFPTPALQ